MPLSLVGTFGVMYLLGFSLNNLTLMALTIATGFVVDDAIVMIENIARYIEDGEPPLEAALKGAEQIGFTIISLTVSLIAVLIPLLFMGDVVGRLFREFAVTLARHDPDLGGRLADADADDVRAAAAARARSTSRAGSTARPSASFDAVIARYGRDAALGAAAPDRDAARRRRRRSSLTVVLYVVVPKGFFPVQDTGVIHGHLRGAADDLVRGDGRAPAGAGARRSSRTRPSRACRRSSASTAPTRRSTAAAS